MSMPKSRPMSVVGSRCHELRVQDESETWRFLYRTDPDAIVIVEVFSKKTGQTPEKIIDVCRQRLKDYDNA